MATLQGSNIVGAYEGKTHLSELLEKVEAGEEITITKHGAPMAKLVPVKKNEPRGARRRHWADSDARLCSILTRIEGQGPN